MELELHGSCEEVRCKKVQAMSLRPGGSAAAQASSSDAPAPAGKDAGGGRA